MNNNVQTPDYLGHRQRLRDRFLKSDGRDMADYELLELVLTYAIVRRDVKPIAKLLIKEFGSFANVINASYEDLINIKGISENTAVLLKMINSAILRASWQKLSGEDAPVLKNIDDLIDYCRASMCYQDVEELRIIYLNSKLKVICEETLQKGTINNVAIHPREVIKSALQNHACSIIMVHNHPSGDTTPSKQDIMITKQIKDAAECVGVILQDHIVIGKYGHFSFRAERLI